MEEGERSARQQEMQPREILQPCRGGSSSCWSVPQAGEALWGAASASACLTAQLSTRPSTSTWHPGKAAGDDVLSGFSLSGAADAGGADAFGPDAGGGAASGCCRPLLRGRPCRPAAVGVAGCGLTHKSARASTVARPAPRLPALVDSSVPGMLLLRALGARGFLWGFQQCPAGGAAAASIHPRGT